jgi:hypothetical protein
MTGFELGQNTFLLMASESLRTNCVEEQGGYATFLPSSVCVCVCGGGGWISAGSWLQQLSTSLELVLHALEHKTGVCSLLLLLTTIFGVTGLFLSDAKSFLLLPSHGLLF